MENKFLIEILKQDGFTYEEVQSILRWLDDLKYWKTIPYEQVKKQSREKIFNNQEILCIR